MKAWKRLLDANEAKKKMPYDLMETTEDGKSLRCKTCCITTTSSKSWKVLRKHISEVHLKDQSSEDWDSMWENAQDVIASSTLPRCV